MVVMPAGPSRKVGLDGLIIGRHSECDIVASDPAMSRRHALIRVTSDGVELVPLGTGPVSVNGTPTDRPHMLAHGDRLAFPGLALHVEIEDAPASETANGFMIERAGGGRFGLGSRSFSVGGGANDDLYIDDLPASALVFSTAAGGPRVELRAGDATHDGVPLERGVAIALSVGESVTCGDETFTIVAAGDHADATTAVGGGEEMPHAIVIEMLPRGGLVMFSLASGTRSVYLADRRFDLLLALLRPPEGYQAGDIISDDVLCAGVWPRRDGVGRTEVNTLISRCRRDLVEAGLNGARLIQRAPGGGGTRFMLARGATVTVRG